MLTEGALELLRRLHRELTARAASCWTARRAPGRAGRGRLARLRGGARGLQRRAGPDALQDRRVEITGPTSRKMVINALNSGARGFMADFEDANSPTWSNMVAAR